MKYLKTIYLLLCCTLALAACSDDDENSRIRSFKHHNAGIYECGVQQSNLIRQYQRNGRNEYRQTGFCYGTASIRTFMTRPRSQRIGNQYDPDRPDSTRRRIRKSLCHPKRRARYSEETSFTTPAETLSDELAAYEAPTM